MYYSKCLNYKYRNEYKKCPKNVRSKGNFWLQKNGFQKIKGLKNFDTFQTLSLLPPDTLFIHCKHPSDIFQITSRYPPDTLQTPSWPVLTWLDFTWHSLIALYWLDLSYPVLIWPVLTWPVLTWAVLTWLVLTWPLLKMELQVGLKIIYLLSRHHYYIV